MHPNLDPDFATELLQPPGTADNKYTRGTVGFVTGSEQYPGAALLGINAAFELGIGMVRYLGPKVVTDLILSNRPEVVPGLDRSKALVVGSGIGHDNQDQLANIRNATSLGLPLVIDAGGLQLVETNYLKAPAVLTPHALEAERLFSKLGHVRHRKDIEANPIASARELSELTNQVVLLKGSITVIATPSGETIESGPGSVHLATAGTGDVLAGMIGALVAKHLSHATEIDHSTLAQIALVANQLHSEAAEVAASNGEFGASAVCAAISNVVGN